MLVLNNITFEFGSRALYKDTSWHIKPGEKIGLIGANGTGKSTLLRVITGEYSLSGGEVTRRKDLTLGFLNQNSTSRLHLLFLPHLRRQDQFEERALL